METIRGALKSIKLGSVLIHVSSNCDPTFGPSGNFACVLGEPYYKKYQYATCQTNLYIKLNSDNRHVCRSMADGTQPLYCWNQCMLELHELAEGPVYSDCECSPGDSLTNNPMTSYIKLPGNCYSPNGRDCSWFNKCLHAKYSCSGNNFNDMIGLASAICHTQEKIKDAKGYKWLASVTACLQVQMAPVLKQWIHLNCSTLDQKASAVQQTCLKNPLGVESLCELEPTDIWFAFWAIREYFTTNIVSEITGFLTKVQDCSNGKMVSVLRKVKLNLGKKIKRIPHSVVEKYLTKVVNELKWKEKGVFLLATYEQNQYITILIALRQNIGSYHNTTVDRSLDDILTNLADAFENGTFQFVVDGEFVEPDTMFACSDYICSDTYLHRNATYPTQQGKLKTNTHTNKFIYIKDIESR
ncbi:unnamed protein product [Mytilus coruscus]|uniref:Uncharacterized protein n=1 Tax=Mytilus coruscus TaxID=42192 RepID=A0A6J7ZZC6_MYTCO|nr:unnamed protein product [Mytilus coruscus]